MKVFGYILNVILIIGIVTYIVVLGFQSMELSSVSTDLIVKKIKSFQLSNFVEKKLELGKDTDCTTLEEKKIEEEHEEKVSFNSSSTDIVTEEVSSTIDDVLETQIGSLSGYGPDCVGCSGFLASGIDVRGGNIYYLDSVYGNVRILAGDRDYPFGTIVRVKGSRLPEFIGIVLDRGGAIGIGKSYLFDLLYPSSSEALLNEVSYHTTFEILRYGY